MIVCYELAVVYTSLLMWQLCICVVVVAAVGWVTGCPLPVTGIQWNELS